VRAHRSLSGELRGSRLPAVEVAACAEVRRKA
jgi:hypothetical protein